MEDLLDYYKGLANHVADRWNSIRHDAYEGIPYRHLIALIEDHIKDERGKIDSLPSDRREEALFHLNQVISAHNHNYSWLDRTLAERTNFIDWWKTHINEEFQSIRAQAHDSRKLVLLTHGTAMLTSLTALGAIQTTIYTSSFLTVALGSLVGFILAIIAQIIWLESYGSVFNKLNADFKPTHSILRVRAYGRYLKKRFNREIIWSTRITYISVAVFPLYSFLAIAVAFHAK